MSTGKQPVALAFGISKMRSNPSQLAHNRELLDMVRQKNIKLLDTARHYSGGESEKFVSNEGLYSKFQMTTKAPMCLKARGSSKEGILKGWEESENALKHGRVTNYLLHCPDENMPIVEAMEGIQSLYLAGKFEKGSQISQHSKLKTATEDPVKSPRNIGPQTLKGL